MCKCITGEKCRGYNNQSKSAIIDFLSEAKRRFLPVTLTPVTYKENNCIFARKSQICVGNTNQTRIFSVSFEN